jgi:16S rRNA (guanine966-N2)-methyltransferase
MHISSGQFEGVEIEDPKECTPTSCRTLTVKEEIFTIIGNRVLDSSVLDINDSNGMYGIEALSRGASCVRFINEDKSETEFVYENITRVGLNPLEFLVREGLGEYLEKHEELGCQKKLYDVVFFEAYRPEDFDFIEIIIGHLNFTGILIMIYPFHNNFTVPKKINGGEVVETREVEDKKVAIILKNKIEKS